MVAEIDYAAAEKEFIEYLKEDKYFCSEIDGRYDVTGDGYGEWKSTRSMSITRKKIELCVNFILTGDAAKNLEISPDVVKHYDISIISQEMRVPETYLQLLNEIATEIKQGYGDLISLQVSHEIEKAEKKEKGFGGCLRRSSFAREYRARLYNLCRMYFCCIMQIGFRGEPEEFWKGRFAQWGAKADLYENDV